MCFFRGSDFGDAQAPAARETEPQTTPMKPSQPPPPPKRTGLPDALKAGVEALSGISMDKVRVHHNASQAAQLQAHAFAQGSDIHAAPGQGEHAPHEAWHVVQQAQGRVKPTLQMEGGAVVNDDKSLEREADAMGTKAAKSASPLAGPAPSTPEGT